MPEKGTSKNGKRKAPPLAGGFTLVCLILLLLIQAGHEYRAGAQTPPGSTNGDSMVTELVTIDSEIKSINSRLAELDGKSQELEEQISNIGSTITATRERLSAKRKALSSRAREIYVNGRESVLVTFLSSRDFSDFLKRSEYLKKVTDQDARLVRETREQAEKLSEAESELKARKKEIDKTRFDLRRRKERLGKVKSERAALLAQAGARSREIERRSGEVESRMQELNPTPSGRHTGRFLIMVATAYSPEEPGLNDSTASGLKATRGIAAVDPAVIPLGTRLHVEGYGYALAADTGSAIKGMRIDLCFDTLEECRAYGRRTVKVEILD